MVSSDNESSVCIVVCVGAVVRADRYCFGGLVTAFSLIVIHPFSVYTGHWGCGLTKCNRLLRIARALALRPLFNPIRFSFPFFSFILMPRPNLVRISLLGSNDLMLVHCSDDGMMRDCDNDDDDDDGLVLLTCAAYGFSACISDHSRSHSSSISGAAMVIALAFDGFVDDDDGGFFLRCCGCECDFVGIDNALKSLVSDVSDDGCVLEGVSSIGSGPDVVAINDCSTDASLLSCALTACASGSAGVVTDSASMGYGRGSASALPRRARNLRNADMVKYGEVSKSI